MKTSELQITGVISEEEDFYGYLRGLLLVEGDPENGIPNKLAAVFEASYSPNPVTVRQVPDAVLFRMLTEYLCADAHNTTVCDDNGSEKLWIKKENGVWSVAVDVP